MLLPVHPQLGARLAAHSPIVQLGKQMLSKASNERVPITDQHHTESNAPFVKDRGPKRGMYHQIGDKSGVCVWGGGGGGKWYVTNVCTYAALFRVYSCIITQTACHRAHCRRRRESIPRGMDVAP